MDQRRDLVWQTIIGFVGFFAFLAVMFGIAGLLLGGVVFAIVDAIALKRSERRGN